MRRRINASVLLAATVALGLADCQRKLPSPPQTVSDRPVPNPASVTVDHPTSDAKQKRISAVLDALSAQVEALRKALDAKTGQPP